MRAAAAMQALVPSAPAPADTAVTAAASGELALVPCPQTSRVRTFSSLEIRVSAALVGMAALAETGIRSPKAVRAVGLANGANPISVVVPCHRVVGADGSLTGYGGGLHRKRWLLTHESALPPDPPRLL